MKTTNKYYDRLLKLQEDYPLLTYQNRGYDKLDQEIRDAHKVQFEEIHQICKKTIGGFSEFNNFKVRKDGTIVVRLQYNYNYEGGVPFIGVGYFPLDLWKDFELTK